MELVVIIVFIIIYAIYKANLNHKVDNYPINKVSIAKMSMDAGKSPKYIQRQMVAGKYDKDNEWKI